MSTNLTNNPYRAINELQQQMQRFWNEALGAGASYGETAQNWNPAVDIYETANGEVVLLTELPGVSESDFKLNTENNVLTISGERKIFDKEKSFKHHRKERSEGTFQRSFTLPSTVDLSKVNATLKNGVLIITLPKKAEARPRTIPVTVK